MALSVTLFRSRNLGCLPYHLLVHLHESGRAVPWSGWLLSISLTLVHGQRVPSRRPLPEVLKKACLPHKSNIRPLGLTDRAVALESLLFVFEAKEGFDGGAAKDMTHHFYRIAQREPRAVKQNRRQVTQLHPSLGSPP